MDPMRHRPRSIGSSEDVLRLWFTTLACLAGVAGVAKLLMALFQALPGS